MKRKTLCAVLIYFMLLATGFAAAPSSDALPYNFRVIDKNVCAGGHPLGPNTNFGNSDKKVLSILFYLKSRGIETVIDLEDTHEIQSRYQRLLNIAGLKRLHVPMNAFKVPNTQEWKMITEAMKRPVYVHCKWGADRTGAVIGRYLVEEKNLAPEDAYNSVITGGRYAGPLGGLKKGIIFEKLKEFIYR